MTDRIETVYQPRDFAIKTSLGMIVAAMDSQDSVNLGEIKLFSIDTPIGRFEISTSRLTFEISRVHKNSSYTLTLSSDPNFTQCYDSPYAAIQSVAQHRIGFPRWDDSREAVSDYAERWTNHLDKRFRMRLLGDYLDAFPNSTYRGLVDYFEHRHSYALNRIQIAGLIEELIVTGQLDRPLQDHMTPSELKSVAALARSWK